MSKSTLLPLLFGVFILLADARMAPNSPSEWDPCTVTITLPPSQTTAQVPRVTLTLDEHAKLVKAEQHTIPVIPPSQPTSSQGLHSESSPHTDTDAAMIGESKYPLSTALFKPSTTFESTRPSGGAETAPPNALSTETSMLVHTKITKTHSVITFSTQTRRKASLTTSGLGEDYRSQESSRTVEGSAVATSSDIMTVISSTPSQSDETSLPAALTTLEILASDSSTPSFQDAGSNPTSSSSAEPFPTQVSAAISSRVTYGWKSVLSFVAVVLILSN